jgi:hypothetical protein
MQGRTWTENTSGAKKIRHYRRRKIYPNNLVKQKTIYEITTNTICISKKRTQTNQKNSIKKNQQTIQNKTKFLFEKNK